MDLTLLLEHLRAVLRRGSWVNLLPPLGLLYWVGSEVAEGDARWALLPWALLAIAGLAMMISNSSLVTNPRDPDAGDPGDDLPVTSRSIRVLCVLLSVAAAGGALGMAAMGETGVARFVLAAAVVLLLLAFTGVDEPRVELSGGVTDAARSADEDQRALVAGEGAFQDIPIRSSAEPGPARRPAAG
ncbi:MAG TPA: hypothetical protein VFR81_15910 [Longimicrobium sp.]|nr:hypothetical protein [Longimicrobium sp.]